MTQTFRALSAALLLSIAAAPLALAQEAEGYRIAAKVQKDGRLIGAPTMTVRSGETASVGVEGDDGYLLTAKAEPVEDAPDQARVTAELRLTDEAEAEPRTMNMVVRLGEPARLEFQAADAPASLEITVAR